MASPPVNNSARFPELDPSIADQLRRAAYGNLAINGPLVDEFTCAEIVAASGALPSGSTTEQAVETAGVLIGAYPSISLADPDTFARMVTMAIARCPSDLHAELLDKLTDRHTRPPTKAHIAQTVSEVVTSRRMLIAGATEHLAEHCRRRVEADAIAERKSDRERIEREFGSVGAFTELLLSGYRRAP